MLYQSKLQPIHWSALTDYTDDRLPSVQPSVECVCNPVVPPDCQTHCTLQFDWLHKVFYSLKIFALSPYA